MPTTVYVDMPDLSGEAGPFYLFLRSKAGALLNAGGDQLSEVQVSAANTGRWSATVAEAWTADLVARIYEGSSESAAAIVWAGWLPNGETELRAEYPSAAGGGGSGDAEQATLLEVQETVTAISAALAGAPVEPTGRIASGGGIVAYIGDDFRVRSGTQLQIPVSDPSGGLYTKLNAIGAANLAFGASRPDKVAGAISGTIASLTTSGAGASQLLLITVEISNCGSGLRPGDDYTYQIEDRQTQGTEVDSFVRIEGSMELRKKVV